METFAASLIAAHLNGLWQTVILFLILWVLFRVLHIGNATTRHAVWSLALVFVLALTLVNLVRPTVAPHSSETRTPTLEASAEPRLTGPGSVVVAHPRSKPIEKGQSPAPIVESRVPMIVGEFQVITGQSADESAWSIPIHLDLGRWPAFLLALWCGISSALLFRVFWSFRHLSFLKQTSRPVDEKYDERLVHWKDRSGSRRAVTLRCSHGVTGPLAVGLMRPVILLPCSLLKKLSDDELNQVGLHEMAHLSRWDDWTKLSQKIFEALFFFNPAVHWMGRQLDLEREMACDDWVIFRTGKPKTYAACLTRLVELTGRLNAPVLAPGGWTTRRQITRRIEMTMKRSHLATDKVSRFGLLAGLFVLFFVGIQCARTSPLVVPPEQEEAMAQEKRSEEAWNPERNLEEEFAVRRQMEEEMKREQEFRALKLEEEQELREQMMRGQLDVVEEELLQAEVRERELLMSEQYSVLAGEEAIDGLPVLGFPAHTLLGKQSTIPEGELIELMEEIAEHDSDLKVKEAAIHTLGMVSSEASAEALIRLFESSPEVEVRKSIIRYLSISQSEKAVEKVKEIARSDSDAKLRLMAVRSLGSLHRGFRVSGLDEAPFIVARPNVVPLAPVPPVSPSPVPEPPKPPKPPRPKQ